MDYQYKSLDGPFILLAVIVVVVIISLLIWIFAIRDDRNVDNEPCSKQHHCRRGYICFQSRCQLKSNN